MAGSLVVLTLSLPSSGFGTIKPREAVASTLSVSPKDRGGESGRQDQ